MGGPLRAGALARRGQLDGGLLVPFSGGSGICPGRNVVQLTTTTFLAALLERLEVSLDPPDRLDPSVPLPSVLDPFRLCFSLGARAGVPAPAGRS